MKALTANEMCTIEGGYSTKCPICSKTISVGVLEVLLLGKKAAYAKAENTAMARHYSYKTGYSSSSSVHK